MILTAIKGARVLGWLRDPTHRKWVWIAVTAVVLIASLLFARYHRQEAVEARVDAEVATRGVEVLTEARATDEAVQARLEGSRRVILDEEETNRAKTDDALQRHQEWANQPVPDDVLGSLRD